VPQHETIDEFAQTRPPDDLFDDDFIPLDEPAPPEPVQHVEPEEITTPEPAPAPAPAPPSAPRGRGAPRGPRRGGNTSRHAPAAPRAVEPTVEPTPEENDGTEASQAAKPERREAAVRGDRSGTGGPKRSKLTEEELSAKLESMKIKNATLMEKHARSQADEELFHQREAVAAQKRKEERVNRQQMMGERERNRLRKLKAQGGREWDIEKDEKEFEGSERRGARRGAFGGVVNDRQSSSAVPDLMDDSRHAAPRERGGRRGRGGRGGDFSGRGRDSRPDAKGNKPVSAPPLPSANDFPDLPEAKKMDAATVEPPKTLEFPLKKSASKIDEDPLAQLIPSGEKTSWADQVEQSS